jgi:hypothetical protein
MRSGYLASRKRWEIDVAQGVKFGLIRISRRRAHRQLLPRCGTRKNPCSTCSGGELGCMARESAVTSSYDCACDLRYWLRHPRLSFSAGCLTYTLLESCTGPRIDASLYTFRPNFPVVARHVSKQAQDQDEDGHGQEGPHYCAHGPTNALDCKRPTTS